jgi:hypothetical protein
MRVSQIRTLAGTEKLRQCGLAWPAVAIAEVRQQVATAPLHQQQQIAAPGTALASRQELRTTMINQGTRAEDSRMPGLEQASGPTVAASCSEFRRQPHADGRTVPLPSGRGSLRRYSYRPVRMLYTRPLLALLVLALLPSGAESQVRLHGLVLDASTSRPIAGAMVFLESSNGTGLAHRTTDEAGRFSFLARGAGPFQLRADRLGYSRTIVGGIYLTAGSGSEVSLHMVPEAIPLAPVEVSARPRSTSPTLAGFHHRRQGPTGWFITREEIERDNRSRVSNILAQAPGVRIVRGVVYMSRGSGCPAQILIDGFHINRPVPVIAGRRGQSTTEMFPIDELVIPGSVEGIEVYQGLSNAPPELRAGHPGCGVVAIWTRRGG